MPVWAWILVAVGVVLIVAAVAWAAYRRRRLRERFGAEYDRAVSERGGRWKGESELAARQKRREGMEIRPLDPAARDRYVVSWRETQARFVDGPGDAVGEADRLILLVMRDRGYPMDEFAQRADDISVDHAQVVEDYRAAHGISMANDHGEASTEDLRQAMVHYRRLFEELLETRGGQRAEVG